MRVIVLIVAALGAMFVGIGIVRWLTPGSVEWDLPSAFGACLLVISALSWPFAFRRRPFGFRRDDLTATFLDRIMLGLVGAVTIMMILPLTLAEHPTPEGGMESAAPGWVVLLLFVIGGSIITESCRKPSRRD
ncbi:hypothetical protein EON81_28495 [bacterium]|nr:MAG: hypothetical protein EON81_28495 [bacterium]